jgi:hypothetical protein
MEISREDDLRNTTAGTLIERALESPADALGNPLDEPPPEQYDFCECGRRPEECSTADGGTEHQDR